MTATTSILAQAQPLLLSMPTEIWWLVGDLLSLEDRVMLSLAHRKLYQHFSHARKVIISADQRQALHRFLLRLDFSLPRHRICSRCVRIHPIRDSTSQPANPCNERCLELTHARYIPWQGIQLVLRTLAHRSLAFGEYMSWLTYRNVISRGGHWRYQRTARLRFGRLLMLFQGEQIFGRLFGLLLEKPRDAIVQEIEGLPCCCNAATRTRLLDACRCALSHGGIENGAWDSILGVAFRTSRVQQCDNCRGFKCSHCADEFEIELRRWQGLESDGFLIVRRYIDLGPVELATSPEQFSLRSYPPYCMIGEVSEPKHPFFRAKSNLKAEWRMNGACVALTRGLTWISWLIMHLVRGPDLPRNSSRQ